MDRYRYVILSRAKPGQEETFKAWYCDRHLADVRRQPGVVSAEVFEIAFTKTYDLDIPAYTLMTIYELETDDPAATIAAIKALSGSEEMPESPALEKSGMLQAVGSLLRRID